MLEAETGADGVVDARNGLVEVLLRRAQAVSNGFCGLATGTPTRPVEGILPFVRLMLVDC